MPISVHCSKCGHGYQLRDELAGKQAKCRCGQTLSIPESTTLSGLLDEEHIGEPPDGMGATMPQGPIQSRPQRPQSSPQFGRGFAKKKRGKDNTTAIIASVAGVVVVLFVVLLAVFLTGSENKPVTSVPPPPVTAGPPVVTSLPGQATPQETFETYQRAWAAKDWARVYSLLTPEAQNQMTAVIAMLSATLGTMNPEFAAVAQKHGIEAMGLAGLSMGGADHFAEEQPARPDANAAASQAIGPTASIQDKKAFFIDALPVFLKFIQSQEFAAIARMGSQMSGVSLSDGFDMLPIFTASTTLSDVRINGQTATGVAKTPATGKEKVTPLKFEQRSGSWYIGMSL